MFDDKQIQSYKSINAPADLRQKVMTACENTDKVTKFPVRKTIYGLSTLAACMLLVISIVMFGNSQPLMLNAGGTTLSDESVALPYVAEGMAENVAYGLRVASLEPAQYTVELTGNQEMEVAGADGLAVLTEEGSIQWTVNVPNEDMVYKLSFLAEGKTYEVSLRYNAQSGIFSIRYEAE